MKKWTLALMLFVFPSAALGQNCYIETRPQSITVEETYEVTTPVVSYVTEQRTRHVEYRRVDPVFDVECGLAIAQDYLACSADATTRRQRFRCAFTAALNNIDCIVGGFSTTGYRKNTAPVFPRLAARRTARQMIGRRY